jgi:HTH-type transcriptional regulator/antitoxin HipB
MAWYRYITLNWESIAKSTATALLKRRQQLGLSQADVAARSGLNRRVVGEIERGKTTVRWDVILRIADALGLDMDLRLAGRDAAPRRGTRSTEPWY